MIRQVFFQYLFKALLLLLLCLALYGVLPGANLAVVMGVIIILRLTYIAAEMFRKPVTIEAWHALTDSLATAYEAIEPGVRVADAAALGLSPDATPRALAEAAVIRRARGYAPPRGKLELCAEALGLFTFSALFPAIIALYTSDFFSFRISYGWIGGSVVAVCLGLYSWPHLWPKTIGWDRRRTLWWLAPFPVAAFLFVAGIAIRHPYLNPFHPEHTRLAAEKVLALRNNIVAGNHADWVLRYARECEARGDWEKAASLYREGLRLNSHNREAAERLVALESRVSAGGVAPSDEVSAGAPPPIWPIKQTVDKLPRCQVGPELALVDTCTVVIVPVGGIPDRILDTVGHVIQLELDLPVLVSAATVPLPPHTRIRGLLIGKQWDPMTLYSAFQRASPPLPRAPIKYLLLTPVDIYAEDTNYAFSISWDIGALVALARYGDLGGDDPMLRHRAAKQSLCALLKSFGIPISPDRRCVTSYCHSLEEFDAKGDHPNAATLAQFRRIRSQVNSGWQAFRRADSLPQAQRELREAWEAVRRGDYAAAEPAFETNRDFFPKDPAFHFMRAEIAIRLSRIERARQALAEARTLDPDSPSCDRIEGMICRATGDLIGARSAFERAVARAPNDPQILRYLAPVLEQMGDAKAARQAWERLLALSPGDSEAVEHFCLLLWQAGERDRADSIIRGVVRAQPASSALLEGALADYYRATGRDADAVTPAETAAKLAPTDIDAAFRLASVTSCVGNHARAIELAEDMTRRFPGEPRSWRALSLVASVAKDLPTATSAYQEWQRTAPRDPDAYSNYGFFLHQTGRNAEAREVLERACREFPGYGLAWLNLSVVLEALGDQAAASDARRRANALFPTQQRHVLVR